MQNCNAEEKRKGSIIEQYFDIGLGELYLRRVQPDQGGEVRDREHAAVRVRVQRERPGGLREGQPAEPGDTERV